MMALNISVNYDKVSNSDTDPQKREYRCDICMSIFNLKEKLNAHMVIHRNDKPFICGDCGKCFTRKASLEKHMVIHASTKPYLCEFCAKRFSAVQTLKIHVYRHHLDYRPHKCKLCGKSYTIKRNLECHIRSHSNKKPFKCDTCGRGYARMRTLLSHKDKENHKITGNECFIYEPSEDVDENSFYDSQTGKYECNICGSVFLKKGNLKSHMVVHREEKAFICEVCGKGFPRKASLQQHVVIHTGIKPFLCEYCGDQFSAVQNLRTHKYSFHLNYRPHKCKLCGKCYTVKQNLKYHMQSHTNSKPYRCDTCGSGYSTQRTLLSHKVKAKHKITGNESVINPSESEINGNVDFKCDVCKKLCGKSQLNINKIIHSNDTQFICRKEFKRKFALEHHQNHTDNEAYLCNQCGLRFTSISSKTLDTVNKRSVDSDMALVESSTEGAATTALSMNSTDVSDIPVQLDGSSPFDCSPDLEECSSLKTAFSDGLYASQKSSNAQQGISGRASSFIDIGIKTTSTEMQLQTHNSVLTKRNLCSKPTRKVDLAKKLVKRTSKLSKSYSDKSCLSCCIEEGTAPHHILTGRLARLIEHTCNQVRLLETVRRFACEICQKSYSTYYNLKMHLKNHMPGSAAHFVHANRDCTGDCPKPTNWKLAINDMENQSIESWAMPTNVCEDEIKPGDSFSNKGEMLYFDVGDAQCIIELNTDSENKIGTSENQGNANHFGGSFENTLNLKTEPNIGEKPVELEGSDLTNAVDNDIIFTPNTDGESSNALQSFICEICGKFYFSYDNLEMHQKNHMPSVAAPFVNVKHDCTADCPQPTTNWNLAINETKNQNIESCTLPIDKCEDEIKLVCDSTLSSENLKIDPFSNKIDMVYFDVDDVRCKIELNADSDNEIDRTCDNQGDVHHCENTLNLKTESNIADKHVELQRSDLTSAVDNKVINSTPDTDAESSNALQSFICEICGKFYSTYDNLDMQQKNHMPSATANFFNASHDCTADCLKPTTNWSLDINETKNQNIKLLALLIDTCEDEIKPVCDSTLSSDNFKDEPFSNKGDVVYFDVGDAQCKIEQNTDSENEIGTGESQGNANHFGGSIENTLNLKTEPNITKNHVNYFDVGDVQCKNELNVKNEIDATSEIQGNMYHFQGSIENAFNLKAEPNILENCVDFEGLNLSVAVDNKIMIYTTNTDGQTTKFLRKFACDSCEKSYSTYNNLVMHRKNHMPKDCCSFSRYQS